MYRRVFFFNDTATTEIYTLSLHDALPIWMCVTWKGNAWTASLRKATALAVVSSSFTARCTKREARSMATCRYRLRRTDRKSTRLNSSHANISYAVFCLKKKKYNIIDKSTP